MSTETWIPILAYVVASVINGLLHYQHPTNQPTWHRILRTILDRV